jgi:bacillithiol biosynthesis cysteine-adding enzyme BshC
MPAATVQVRTEPLGADPLAQAVIDGRTPGWVPAIPADAPAWSAHIGRVRAGANAGWLAALAPAFAASGAASDRLRLAAERGVVVTTGQQSGLFGGPGLVWAKALTALALADALEAACGVPVAPVFWAATDDADFVEAATTWVAMPGGAVPLSIAPTAPEGTAMAATPLGKVGPALAGLEAAAGSAAFGEPLIAVREAYAPPTGTPTVGESYVTLLRRLLEPLGVAVLDAAHPAVRAQAFPLLRQALVRAEAIDAALATRDTEIRAAAYAPQVTRVPGLSLVFRYAGGVRTKIALAAAALAADAASPGDLTASVLLRPIVERAILPTVAYAAGPSELAYFAQSTAVAAALGQPPPTAVPRWSGTIIEPQIAETLARYGLSIDDFREPHAVEGRLLNENLPTPVRRALDAIGASVDAGIRAVLDADTARLAPSAVAEGARRAIHHRLALLERRYVAGVRDAHRAMLFDLATLRGALFPDGERQERRLNLLPTLARHGSAVFAAMRERADAHSAALLGDAAAR